MTIQDDRQLVENITEQAKIADRNKLQPMLGIVVEVGVGANLGMVRVRRTPHELTDVGRPFYYVIGAVPAVDTEVWCQANFATGFVFGDFLNPEDIPDPGILEVADSGTARPRQPQINLGAGLTAVDNPGAARTDLSFQKSSAGISNQTVQDSGTARAERAALNLGAGFLATDNSALNRTDITLNPVEKLASPSVPGFMDSADKGKLDGVEAGATADQTPGEIFNATKSLDGPGSTLDADMVDGVHASGLAPSSHVGAAGTGAHPLATTGQAGFMGAADKTALNNAAGAGHTHVGFFPEVQTPNNYETLGAGGLHLWNHLCPAAPRFIFFQVREAASADWKPVAEGIAPGPSQFSVAANATQIRINNNEGQTVEYRGYWNA